MKSREAMAQFGRDHGKHLAHAVGLRRGKTPAKSTLSDLFRALDVEAFEGVLTRWIQGRPPDAGVISPSTARPSRATPRATCRESNGLHYVRDVTGGEDGCRARKGSSAPVRAEIRNAVVQLRAGVQAAATRHFAACPAKAIPLLLT